VFIDASVIVAIIGQEDDWISLSDRIETAVQAYVSPMAIWEAVIALARHGGGRSFVEADRLVAQFVEEAGAEIIPVTAEIGTLALDASRRFGRGRHKADLNFGDCFAYACARHRGVPLLFKGEDFIHTDIEAA
jgi:ribonuclease VapC